MTKVRSFDAELPDESHACLLQLPEIEELSGFINRLHGGHSGAQIWQVRFRPKGQVKDAIGILKIGSADIISREIQNHKDASRSSDCPPMPTLLSVGSPVANWRALIFSVAQNLLWRAQTISDCVREARSLKAINDLCNSLVKWYSNGTHQTCDTFSFLRLPHQYQLGSKPDWFKIIASQLGVNINDGQILFEGEEDSRALPNPFHVLVHKEATGNKRFSVPFGSTHGDLHAGNIVVSRDGSPMPMLIDLALFDANGSILHDLAFLETSIALESVDLRSVEGKRQWEKFFQCGYFVSRPEELPTGLVGLRAQVGDIRQVALSVAGDDAGIQEEYKIGYLHAIASAALHWVQFEDIPAEKRLGALYIAARALEALRQRRFVSLLQGLSKISWRPLTIAVSVDEERRIEESRQWFRSHGRGTLQECNCVLVVGPALVNAVMNYTETDLTTIAGLSVSERGLGEHDPAWADELQHSEQDDTKRRLVGKRLRETKASPEFVELLSSIPWIAVFDWSQAPDLFHQFDQILIGQQRVYRIFPEEQAPERDRLAQTRIPWVAIRGAPDPIDCMVWGEDWIDQLQRWKRRLGTWSSQCTYPAFVIGVGLDQPMKEDIWAMVSDIFGAQAQFVNVSHPVERGRPSQRAILRRMTHLDLTPQQWLELVREFFSPSPRILAEDATNRMVIFRLPESRQAGPGIEGLRELTFEPDEAVRLSEHFEVLTEGTGKGVPPVGRPLGDLFRGYPVLWQEIRQGFPITRACEKEIIEAIRGELEIGNPRRLHLYHEPGAGGSVLVRQIAYKLYFNENIPVLILHKFSADEVSDCLRAFWYQIDRSFLVIAEDNVCSPDNWEIVNTILQQEQIPAVVLLVSTRSPEWMRRLNRPPEKGHEPTSYRRFFLPDQLSDKELDDLRDQLELLLGPEARDRLRKSLSRSLFGTIFGVFEGDFTEHRRIVGQLIRDIPPASVSLLKTLAFFRLYTDAPWVPRELLLRLASVTVDMDPLDALANLRDRVVLQHGEGASSVLAVSHPILAEDLLAELLGGENES